MKWKLKKERQQLREEIEHTNRKSGITSQATCQKKKSLGREVRADHKLSPGEKCDAVNKQQAVD